MVLADSDTVADDLVTGYERTLTAEERRASGAHYTPSPVAARLAALALADLGSTAAVCDPACGAGAMLLAAGRALVALGAERADVARAQLWGIDRDAGAVAAARAAIVAWSGADPGDHLVVGDGLAAPSGWASRFDVVLGNPPFLNQLERATARTEPLPRALAPLAGPYTDTAWLFLAAGVRLARAGGRVVLIQPQSVAAARDAGRVRHDVMARAAIEGMWTCDDPIFAASVRVCAPVLRVAVAQGGTVARWTGAAVAAIEPVAAPGPAWSTLLSLSDPAPAVTFAADDGVLGALVTATAGFRQQFYGLAPFVVDERDHPDETHPRLVTTAHVEPGRLEWGERPVRYAGRRWSHPRLDLAALRLGGDRALVRWVEARLVPKVLVATQTRVVEAAPDHDGCTIPSTPVIAVEGGADPWVVAAVLSAPPVSAWALGWRAGAALSPGAIKLAARDVLAVPLPSDEPAWQEAAAHLATGDLLGCGAAMNRAYGAGPDVLAWWRSRLAR